MVAVYGNRRTHLPPDRRVRKLGYTGDCASRLCDYNTGAGDQVYGFVWTLACGESEKGRVIAATVEEEMERKLKAYGGKQNPEFRNMHGLTGTEWFQFVDESDKMALSDDDVKAMAESVIQQAEAAYEQCKGT